MQDYEEAREQIEKLAISLAYAATKVEVVGLDDDPTRSETLQVYGFSN